MCGPRMTTSVSIRLTFDTYRLRHQIYQDLQLASEAVSGIIDDNFGVSDFENFLTCVFIGF